MKRFCVLLMCLALGAPLTAAAWWNDAWSERRAIMIDTSASGVEIGSPVADAVIPVRLHSGNFDFTAAALDGADLRFVAADDKTVLAHQIEQFDATNELAVVWVRVPQVAPKTAGQKIYLYFGNAEAQPETAAKPYDAATAAVFHFTADAEKPVDASGNGHQALAALAVDKAGLLGASGKFAGAPLTLAAAPGLQLTAGSGFGFSAWVKLAAGATGATLYAQGPLAIKLVDGKLRLDGVGASLTGGAVTADAWHHVAVKVGAGKTALYVDGVEVVTGEGDLPAAQAEVKIGEGLNGLLDEVRLASAERSADWFKFSASVEGADSKALKVVADEEAGGEGEVSYMGILVSNLTVDAWVVIVILGVMLAIAVVVMIVKARLVIVTDSDNREFLRRFRQATDDFLELEKGAAHPRSSLFRLYQAGIRELQKRSAAVSANNLSGASIDAIKAAVDADLVRESHKLNAQMVLLTIAISGGPFLGLLGTVVGVMITFAAIAAAGDVNVNAIAPGIAAALLATVAGLAVAIPALFGYNYLASRIKNISADMQIFVDEFITRIAERYSH